MSLRIVFTSIVCNPGNCGKLLSKAVKAIGWQLWKRTIRKPKSIVLANGRRFIANSDCVVSSALIYADWPEYHELQFLRRYLHQDDFLLDVGANVGHLGMLLSDVVDPKRIVAFEPTPITFQRLNTNWTENGFSTDTLFGVAVGNEDGTIEFPDLAHPGTMNSRSAVATSERTCKVPIRKLDSYREIWQNQKIGLLKIDVEGFELDVFLGAAETLRNDRPGLVMFESLNGQIEPAIGEQLKIANYEVFQLDEAGKVEVGKNTAQNLFASPKESMNRFS